MRLYLVIWSRTTIAVVAVAMAVLVSDVVISRPLAAGFLLATGTLAGTVLRRRPVRLSSAPAELRVVIGIAAAIVTIAGLSPLVGPGSGAIALALAAAGLPLLVARRSGELDRSRSPVELTTDELCDAWRASGVALAYAALPATDRARLVVERSRYLDELERRHPEGVARWMAEGRPEVDPRSFV